MCSDLRITIPRRSRWAPYHDSAVRECRDYLAHKLNKFEEITDRDEKIVAFIDLIRSFCHQPVMLAAYPVFRGVAAAKVDEITKDVLQNYTPHEEAYVEATYAFGDLMSEIHDHPLYKEE